MISDGERRQLDELGYVVLEQVLPHSFLDRLRHTTERLWAAEGENAGSEFRKEPHARRLANLVDKDELFWDVISNARVLELVKHVIGDRVKLSSLNARSADPFSPDPQPLHVDAGAIADDAGYWVCNTIWLLDDFTAENGATRIIPGSHRWRQAPQQVLPDPMAPHPDEVLITAPAGTIVVMNTHAWHGGTANRTGHPRRAVHGFYTRWDKAQQQYQKKLLRPETQARLSPELRALLALDDPLNDELCARETGMSGFLKA
ncbi:MAG TPA: phytanoyl-CoA dioxygenase family protein [Bryobacteraceae bacterium]|nr:phytanoyl-CoA dioxygenase family protein [Bryobacteraceae bacterium]